MFSWFPCGVILAVILSQKSLLPSQLTWHFLTVVGEFIGTFVSAKAAVSCRFFCVRAMTDCYLNFPPCRRVVRELR